MIGGEEEGGLVFADDSPPDDPFPRFAKDDLGRPVIISPEPNS